MSALRQQGKSVEELRNQRIVIAGAGSAGPGFSFFLSFFLVCACFTPVGALGALGTLGALGAIPCGLLAEASMSRRAEKEG